MKNSVSSIVLCIFSLCMSMIGINVQSVMYRGGWFSTSTTETSTSPSLFWHIEKIELDKAWDIHTGHSSVRVAHVDAGINSGHPDFQGRLNTNLSVSFSPNSNDPFSPAINHGTKTAGILGARPNNGNAVGATWYSDIVCIRADGPANLNYSETFDTILPAINYASEHSIPIISFSGGLTGLTSSQVALLTSAVNSYSGLVVCAAGNDSANLDLLSNDADKIFPQCCFGVSNVLVVGASDANDSPCSFSNFGGNSVHVFAPGSNIPTSSGNNGLDSFFSGTSAACPIVAGVAALIKSVNLSLTASQIKNIITSTVDYSTSLSGKCSSGGRVNAYKALKAAVPIYSDSGNGMNCPNGLRVYTNEWVKFTGESGVKHIHSTGPCQVDGALYASDIDLGPIASAAANTSYPYDYHIYQALNASDTYYLKSVVQLPLGNSFGVQIESHQHNYSEYQWVSLAGHKEKCSECGALSSSIFPHLIPVNQVNVCVLCGGFGNGVFSGTSEEPVDICQEASEDFFIDAEHEAALGVNV